MLMVVFGFSQYFCCGHILQFEVRQHISSNSIQVSNDLRKQKAKLTMCRSAYIHDELIMSHGDRMERCIINQCDMIAITLLTYF